VRILYATCSSPWCRKIVWANRSANDKAVELDKLNQKVAAWKAITEQERTRVSIRLAALADSSDEDSELMTEELEEEDTVLNQFMSRCDKTATQLRAIKLNQTIKNIRTAEEAEVSVGMPSAVVDKVAKQSICDVETQKKAKAQIGIW
jgi:hypothetical protein